MTNPNLQSRYGFHPCDYQLYSKLKFLHRHYWETLRQFHNWHRWYRKESQNRIGREPQYCPCFVDNEPWVKPFTRKGERGFKLYPRSVDDRRVLELYHMARMPNELPVEAFSAEEVARIENLYAAVNEYFTAKDQEKESSKL